jgi:small-conductance mechanosensitive channel
MSLRKCVLTLFSIVVVFCFFCEPAWSAVAPAKNKNTALTTDLSTTQKQLDANTAQLATIVSAMEQKMLSDGTLQLMQQQIESVVTRTQQLQHAAEKKANEIDSLINALGPAPKATEAAEDPVTANKRQQLNEALALYNGQVKQAGALISQSISLSNALAQRRLQNKAKGLMQRSLPLYDPIIWQRGISNSDDAMLKAWDNTLFMFNKSWVALKVKATAILFLATSLLILFTSFILSWLLSHHFGRRYVTATPNLVRKIISTITNIIAAGIIPLSAALLIILYAKKYEIIYQAQWYILNCLSLMIGGIGISYLLIKNILSPNLPSWRILQIKDESAKPLAKQLMLFLILAIFNWFITTIAESIPLDFLIPCEFLLRTAACASGLILLKKRYWTSELIARTQQDAPSTTRNAQLIFIHYLRIASITVFISNPIFMLLGFISLANFLFISFLQTVAIVALLLGLHITFYQVLGKFIGVGAENILGKTFNLGERSRQILHYWLIVIIDIIFFIAGMVAILLTWGLDRHDLWRLIKPLFIGFNIGHYHVSLTAAFIAIGAFVAFFVITRLLQRFLDRRVFPYTNLDFGVQNALHQGVGYVGITLGLLVSIGMIGINLTNLALIAGALSVGIGFGLQNIVSNFIAGIIVLVERPIKIGDRIIVGQDEGTVRRISVRATEIEAADGSSVLIPNSELISGRVRNWTFRNPLTKLEIAVGVAYGSDTRLVEKLLLQVAEQNLDVTRDPPPKVSFMNFGASALEFKLVVCIYDIDKRNTAGSELRYAIEKTFREYNVEMPFPQCDVHIVSNNS